MDVAITRFRPDWNRCTEIAPRYNRPSEVSLLIADFPKAKAKLGWEPKTDFRALIDLMVDAGPEHLGDRLSGKIGRTT